VLNSQCAGKSTISRRHPIGLAIAAVFAHMAVIGFSAGWLGSALLNASASAFLIFLKHRYFKSRHVMRLAHRICIS
jgi:hypothetical protein